MGESERGGDMDDEGTRKGRRTEMGGDGMWGQAEKRLGVTLSCQLVFGVNTHVMQRKSRGKSQVQEILASCFVKGGYCKLL